MSPRHPAPPRPDRSRAPAAVALLALLAFSATMVAPRVARALPQCCSICYDDHEAMCTRTRQVWIPRYIANAAKGDLIFHQGNEVILLILSHLGQFFSHVGIFTDNGRTFRHNTFSFDKDNVGGVIEQNINPISDYLLGTIDYGDIYFNRQWLAKGPPGMQTLALDSSVYFTPANATTSILKAQSGRGGYTAIIADKFQSFVHEYRLGAFKDYRREEARNGGMCSGSLLKASEMAFASGARKFLIKRYTQSLVQASIYALWLFVRDQVYQQCGQISDCDRLSPTQLSTVAYGLAHQIAHCFNQGPSLNPFSGKLECSRMDAVAWASYPTGDALSISPDDIINQEQECFAGGTAITMADGSQRAIEDVRVGDRVLAFDTDGGQVVASRVTQTFVHPDKEATVLVNGTLETTANHPFFVGGRWLEARFLQPGDELLSATTARSALGEPAVTMTALPVASVVTLSGRKTVYNLEVEGQHDYFAGGVLVHNKPNLATDYVKATSHTTATYRGNAVVGAQWAGGYWQSQQYVDQACLDSQCSGCSWASCPLQ